MRYLLSTLMGAIVSWREESHFLVKEISASSSFSTTISKLVPLILPQPNL